jgi:hypothetical protein
MRVGAEPDNYYISRKKCNSESNMAWEEVVYWPRKMSASTAANRTIATAVDRSTMRNRPFAIGASEALVCSYDQSLFC